MSLTCPFVSLKENVCGVVTMQDDLFLYDQYEKHRQCGGIRLRGKPALIVRCGRVGAGLVSARLQHWQW